MKPTSTRTRLALAALSTLASLATLTLTILLPLAATPGLA